LRITNPSAQVRDESTLDLHLLRKLLKLLRPYRARMAASTLLVILGSLLQLMEPAIVGFTIDLFIAPSKAAASNGLARTVRSWIATRAGNLEPSTGIEAAALLYLALILLGYAVLTVQLRTMNSVGQCAMYDLRNSLFKHLQSLDVSFFNRNPVGQLITRMTTDVDTLNEMFTAGFVSIFGDIILLLGITTILFGIDWRLALVLFSIMPFLALAALWFKRGARVTYREARDRIAGINGFLQERVSGMSIVQLFNRHRREAEKFDALNTLHREANIEAVFYYAIFYPVVELIQSVGIALIIWYGGRSIHAGALSLGALVAFFQYAQRFFEPISDLSEKYNVVQSAMAASERVFRLLETSPEIRSHDEALDLGEVKEIEFCNVWFAYKGEEWVLRDVSFHIGRGEKTAIVGHTGAGKSTLVHLLLRFYDVQRGSIRINGTDIRDFSLASLRRQFAIVQQDFSLFSGSIEENISFGDPRISTAMVREAAMRVRVDPLIQRLEGGYAARLREAGGGLSVGEKQLLMFARALAFNPSVLVLDEATSSVDVETERLIQQGIDVLLAGKTSLIIAHRLSTIQSADRIVVLHRGEVRERGTHRELLALKGLYWKLHNAQFLSMDTLVERFSH
jgi:ATP-binding cassette, subfamily B, multidrug efflux pump